MKRFLKTLALTLALAALPVLALAQDVSGSAAVAENATYTLEEMLTFAMQDEYAAQAAYAAIQTAFGEGNPFQSILQAEQTHQELLNALFTAYGIPVPANTAAQTAVPATLTEAYQTGVNVEVANIKMYETFLAQSGLAQDVRDTFTALMEASKNHLAAFTRNAEKTGLGMRQGMGGAMNSQTTAAGGRGRMQNNTAQTPQCPLCTAVQPAQARQGRGGNGN